MSSVIDFYFDYVSPYTYLANTQIHTLAVELRFVPVVIVDVMKRVNNQPSPLCPPKGRYIGVDSARWAAVYGVPLRSHGAFWEAVMARRFSTRTLIDGAVTAQEIGAWDGYHDAMFQAVWADHRDVHTPEGLDAFARDQGLPADFWQRAASEAIRERTTSNNAEAAERGVFGSPSFFLGDEMFFGNDRLDMIRQRLGMAERGLSKEVAA